MFISYIITDMPFPTEGILVYVYPCPLAGYLALPEGRPYHVIVFDCPVLSDVNVSEK